MTTTQNLHLPQWEADDRIMRTDFNDAMAKIDTAIKAANDDAESAKTKFYTGTYTGNGVQETKHITLGARPKLVVIGAITGSASNYQVGVIATTDFTIVHTTTANSLNRTLVSFSGTGFSIDCNNTIAVNSGLNRSNAEYRYLAIC